MPKKIFVTQERGMLTKRIRVLSVKLMRRKINKTELRLMPYIIHVMMNEQRIDISRVNEDERAILSEWREKGYIEGGAGGLQISTEFWNIICEIVRLGYVDLGCRVEA